MPLLLAILSVLALWALLAVLIVGLLLILKPLEAVRTSLQRIAMGVRAIEQQTGPLEEDIVTLTASLNQAGRALSGAAGQLAQVPEDLDKAAPALLRRV